MMLAAIDNRQQPLTVTRLCQWHRWLFPHSENALHKLGVAALRASDIMQVVSGRTTDPLSILKHRRAMVLSSN